MESDAVDSLLQYIALQSHIATGEPASAALELVIR